MPHQSDPKLERLLARAATRASRRAFFFASALEDYRKIEGLDEVQLSDYLRCTSKDLTRLALCRRPKSESPKFKDEVRAIAQRTGVDAGRLMKLLRHVDALGALLVGNTALGAFMAARDSEDEDKAPSETQGPTEEAPQGNDND